MESFKGRPKRRFQSWVPNLMAVVVGAGRDVATAGGAGSILWHRVMLSVEVEELNLELADRLNQCCCDPFSLGSDLLSMETVVLV